MVEYAHIKVFEMFYVYYRDKSFVTSDQYTNWLDVPNKNDIDIVRVLVNGNSIMLYRKNRAGAFFYFKTAFFIINTGKQTSALIEEAGFVYDKDGSCDIVRVKAGGKTEQYKSNVNDLKLNLDLFTDVKMFMASEKT